MSCQQHAEHSHTHRAGCGHRAIGHEGHTDYLHDGHLHNSHAGHTDEHNIGVGAANPAACTPSHKCGEHEAAHQHGAGCGHAQVPHGDHEDFLVGEHLHHQHGNHCDDHGGVRAG